jgi:hypothetical protein
VTAVETSVVTTCEEGGTGAQYRGEPEIVERGFRLEP